MWETSSEKASNPLLQLRSPCCFSSMLLSMLLSMPRLNYSPYFCQSEGSLARQAWKSSNLSNFQLFLFFLIWAIKPTRGVMARRSRRQNFQQWTIFFHFPLKPNLGVNSVRVEVKSCGAKTKFGDHVKTSCDDNWSSNPLSRSRRLPADMQKSTGIFLGPTKISTKSEKISKFLKSWGQNSVVLRLKGQI